MTKLLIAIAFISFNINFSLLSQTSATFETKEELGESAFQAFKTEDLELFQSLLMTFEDHEYILKDLNIGDSLKQVFSERGKGAARHLNSISKQNFKEILELAKQLNLNWNEAEIVEIKEEKRNQKGIKRSDILIKIESNKMNFVLLLRGCHKSKSWVIAQKVSLNKIS